MQHGLAAGADQPSSAANRRSTRWISIASWFGPSNSTGSSATGELIQPLSARVSASS